MRVCFKLEADGVLGRRLPRFRCGGGCGEFPMRRQNDLLAAAAMAAARPRLGSGIVRLGVADEAEFPIAVLVQDVRSLATSRAM